MASLIGSLQTWLCTSTTISFRLTVVVPMKIWTIVFGALITQFSSKQTEEEIAKKLIVTENFEAYAAAGGVTYTTRDGKQVPSYIGMAMWQPKKGRKGGIGSYHMEKDYAASPVYKYLRRCTANESSYQNNKTEIR